MSLFTSLHHTRRLAKIGWILARHDVLFICETMGISNVWLLPAKLVRKPSKLTQGQRLARAFEALGPAFIKLGQMLSCRADLVGEAIAADLANLRDQLPPFAASKARAIVEAQLGRPIYEVFSDFDDTAIAAASVAQVHRATLHDGSDVAVKILRPGIHQQFKRDIALLYWLAECIEQHCDEMRRLKLREVVQLFDRITAAELDLRFEAAAATELANNTKNDAGFHVPKMHWQYCSQHVLISDWVDGVPISDVAAIRALNINAETLLTQLTSSFFSQAFGDGFFHGDLHAGNILVQKDGTIAVVDFGIMGRLDASSRLYVAQIFKGFLQEDYQQVAQLHIRAGYVPPHHNADAFAQACMAIAKPMLDRPLASISLGQLLGQLLSVTRQFDMQTRPELLLLQKNMVLIEGIGRMLKPDSNLWEMAREPIDAWAKDAFSPIGKAKHLAARQKEIAARGLAALTQLESAIDHIGNEQGIRLHPGTLAQLTQQRNKQQRGWLWLGWAALIFVMVFAL